MVKSKEEVKHSVMKLVWICETCNTFLRLKEYTERDRGDSKYEKSWNARYECPNCGYGIYAWGGYDEDTYCEYNNSMEQIPDRTFKKKRMAVIEMRK